MDIKTAERYIKACTRYIGGGFHPDDPFEKYITRDGVRLFTDVAAARHNKRMEQAYELLGDRVYTISLDEAEKYPLENRGFSSSVVDIVNRMTNAEKVTKIFH